jgi:hypothetical protein
MVVGVDAPQIKKYSNHDTFICTYYAPFKTSNNTQKFIHLTVDVLTSFFWALRGNVQSSKL